MRHDREALDLIVGRPAEPGCLCPLSGCDGFALPCGPADLVLHGSRHGRSPATWSFGRSLALRGAGAELHGLGLACLFRVGSAGGPGHDARGSFDPAPPLRALIVPLHLTGRGSGSERR